MKTMSQTKRKLEVLQSFRRSPEEFVRALICPKESGPTAQQLRALQALADHNMIAIKSGHGTGKDAFIAWALLWFLSLFPNSKALITAPTAHQLSDVFWPELQKWLSMSALRDDFTLTQSRLTRSGESGEQWFAVKRTSSSPEAIAGMHAKNMLVIVDEASGVKDEIMGALFGALSSAQSRLILIGNPTRRSGEFYEAFHANKSLFFCDTWPCTDSPLVSKVWLTQAKNRFASEPNLYRSRVLGEFPKDEDDQLFPSPLVRAAISRAPKIEKSLPLVVGVDPARLGSDFSAICLRMGRVCFPLFEKRRMTGRELCEKVLHLIENARGKEQPCYVFVDETGIGASPLDFLRESANENHLKVKGVSFGGKSTSPLYANKAAQMAKLCKKALEEGLSLPSDKVLEAQLTCRKYFLTPRGALTLESKADLKKRGIMSPNRADALMLTFADEKLENRDLIRGLFENS